MIFSSDLAVFNSSSMMMIFMYQRKFNLKKCTVGNDLDLFIEQMFIAQVNVLKTHTERIVLSAFGLHRILYDNPVSISIKADVQGLAQRYHIVFDTVFDQ